MEDISTDGRILLKWIVKKKYVILWSGFMWLRIESSDELL
jgi:hypothetical protein